MFYFRSEINYYNYNDLLIISFCDCFKLNITELKLFPKKSHPKSINEKFVVADSKSEIVFFRKKDEKTV